MTASRHLSSNISYLQRDIVIADNKEQIPPWVEYTLTEKGQSVGPVLQSI
ncbi:winged helix-turn-helix transcriptional regulator [uncultured Oscillibacter sp.]